MIIPNLILAAAIGAQSMAAPPVTPAPPPRVIELTRAITSLPSLFSADDYPAAALRHDEQGTVAFRLTVSPDGRVSACDVSGSSGSASLDSATCSILQRRARFQPARDAQGQPIEDHYYGRIRWELPPPAPLPVENAQFRAVFSIGPARDVTGCTFESGSGSAVQGDGDCQSLHQMVGALLKQIPASVTLNGRELVIEIQLVVGSGDFGEAIGSAAKEMLLRRDRFMLTIDASGKTIDCRADGDGALSATDPPSCEEISKRTHAPLPPDVTNRRERRMTIIQAAYLRPKTP